MSKRDEELKTYLSDGDRQSYDDYMKKAKMIRDKAVRSRKAELRFWQQVDEREGEVYRHIMERRAARETGDATQEAGQQAGVVQEGAAAPTWRSNL